MDKEKPWGTFLQEFHGALTARPWHDNAWGILFLLSALLVPTLLLFFNEFFFMPWGKLVMGVLPPGDLGLPLLGHILMLFHDGDKTVQGKERYDKYGGITKFLLLGTPGVSVSDPDLKKQVLMNEGLSFENSWPPAIQKALGPGSVAVVTGESHRAIRALLSRWLTFDYLKRFLPNVESSTVQSVDGMLRAGSVVCLDEAKQLTFGIIAQMVLSLPEGPIRKELSRLFEVWSKGLVPAALPWSTFGESMKARKAIIKMITQLYLQRKDELSAMSGVEDREPRDILEAFILHGGKGREFDSEVVCDTTLTLLFAGHETTSSLLSWMLCDLHSHPNLIKELRAEHDEIAKGKAPGEGLTWADYKNMKLTQRVINEVLRKNTVVNGVFRKTLQEVKMGKYVIPKGWMVVVNFSHTAKYSNAYFKNPEQFDPNHFSQPTTPFTFTPFGAGARICPGMELARLEASVFLHHVMRRCQWVPLAPDAPPKGLGTLNPGKGYPMKVLPREGVTQCRCYPVKEKGLANGTGVQRKGGLAMDNDWVGGQVVM